MATGFSLNSLDARNIRSTISCNAARSSPPFSSSPSVCQSPSLSRTETQTLWRRRAYFPSAFAGRTRATPRISPRNSASTFPDAHRRRKRLPRFKLRPHQDAHDLSMDTGRDREKSQLDGVSKADWTIAAELARRRNQIATLSAGTKSFPQQADKLQKLGPVGHSGVLGVRRIAAAFEGEGLAAKNSNQVHASSVSAVASVLAGPAPFVGDHARGGRRNPDFPPPRAAPLCIVDFFRDGLMTLILR